MADVTRIASSAVRAFGDAARGLTLDAISAVATGVETAADIVTGRTQALRTLRVRVLILSDERGAALLVPTALDGALSRADRVFTEGAGIRVRVESIGTIAQPAPRTALEPRANRALLFDHILGRTGFITDHVGRPAVLSAVGDPVTVVIVRTIAGNATGCSLGATADWVICQASLFDASNPRTYDETVLAHELAHALNLPHLSDPGNLMYPMSTPPGKRRGTAIKAWQKAILRCNRHVIPPA